MASSNDEQPSFRSSSTCSIPLLGQGAVSDYQFKEIRSLADTKTRSRRSHTLSDASVDMDRKGSQSSYGLGSSGDYQQPMQMSSCTRVARLLRQRGYNWWAKAVEENKMSGVELANLDDESLREFFSKGSWYQAKRLLVKFCKDKFVHADLPRGDDAAVAAAAEGFLVGLGKNGAMVNVAKQIVESENCRDIRKYIEEIEKQVNFDACDL